MDSSDDEKYNRRSSQSSQSKRRRPGRKERERDVSVGESTASSRSPAISAKHDHSRVGRQHSPDMVDGLDASLPVQIPDRDTPGAPPVLMLRSGDRRSLAVGQRGEDVQSIPAMLASQDGPTPSPPTHPQYQLQRNPHSNPAPNTPKMNSEMERPATVIPRSVPCDMINSVKLVDDMLQWCDNGLDMLLDQTDILVVGLLGLQGTGKSTLASWLAGKPPEFYNSRSAVFRTQCRDVRETGCHQTQGIDMFVSSERTIVLDTQPALSPSVMDSMIHNEKKYPSEFVCIENCIEMQSLHIAAFLFAVCNVVVIPIDWFLDRNFVKFLLTAEMLKTPKPTSGGVADVRPLDADYYPQIVFVLNQAPCKDFTVDAYRTMQDTIAMVMKETNLKISGSLHMGDGELIPCLNPDTISSAINLYLLPENKYEDNEVETSITDFRGHPGFDWLMEEFVHRVLSVPRVALTHATLSERNWFHYAARTWDAVRKSQLFAEYNRLLP